MRRQIYTIFNSCGHILSALLLLLLLMHSLGNSVYADLEAQLIFLEDVLILSPNEANKLGRLHTPFAGI